MNFQKFLGLAFCGAMLGGCAIHPVQQDVTRLPTAQIVRQIRCETRAAIIGKAFDLIAQKKLLPGETQEARSVHLANLAERLRGPVTRNELLAIRDGLPPDEKTFFDKYINTAIAFIFTFDVQEQNTLGVGINPLQAITGGSIGVTFAASADFMRANKRFFVISEHFYDNLTDPNLICDAFQPMPNFIYPISGTIGMADVVSTFIDINQAQPLRLGGDTVLALDNKSPNFADTLEFTTTVQASAKPSVALSPAGSSISFAASDNFLSPLAKRMDRHQVIIGLALPPPIVVVLKKTKAESDKESKGSSGGPVTTFAMPGGRNTLQYRKSSNLPTLGAPLAAPIIKRGASLPSTEERALNTAQEQLILNFYGRNFR